MIFRYARHTNNLQIITEFYTKVVGLDILGSFENHETYDGVFLGIKGENWHLEFTSSIEQTDLVFEEEDILVFYPKSQKKYDEIIKNIEGNNVKRVMAKNPYWNRNGTMICDPDGFRVVISPIHIKKIAT